jgi:hypothetical protein
VLSGADQLGDRGLGASGRRAYYGEVARTVKSSITFSSPELPGSKAGGKTPPVTKPPPPCFGGRGPTCDDKLFAAADLFEVAKELDSDCAFTTMTLLNVAVGVSNGSISEAEAQSVTAELAAGSDFMCSMEILSLLRDLKIVNDPPIGGLHRFAQPSNPNVRAARLPSCAARAGSARSFCERLRADELRYLAALRRATGIDTALLTTVDRVSGAYRAHNRSALNLQVRHATALRSQLRAARSGGRAARRAIAALLSSHHLGLSLTAGQEQIGLARALSRLSLQGVS